MRIDLDTANPHIVHMLSFIDFDDRFIKVKSNPLIIQHWISNINGGFLTFNKDLGRKGYGRVYIYAMEATSQGLELKIQIMISSGPEYETFFEGFVENLEDLKVIFKCLGLNK